MRSRSSLLPRERLQGEAGAGGRLPDPGAHARTSADDVYDREDVRLGSLSSGERGQEQLFTAAKWNHLSRILSPFGREEVAETRTDLPA
jgi:hypothetical protein